MFVGLRDMRFARGRFVLMGAIVALLTVLVGFLGGLTGGLAIQNVSGVLALPADRIVLAAPTAGDAITFADSVIGEQQLDAWSSAPQAQSAAPLGISQTRATAGDRRAGVTLFAAPAASDPAWPSDDGMLTLSAPAAAELGVVAGDAVEMGGTAFRVASVGGDDWYSHTPVVRMTLDDWHAMPSTAGAFASAIMVRGGTDAALETATGTVAMTPVASLTALSGFRSEIGSLAMIVGMLLLVSALVTGSFFTVWTLQRKPDIAVLKALGASTGSLLRDALGQALCLLAVGIGVGIAIVAALGVVAARAVPFLLSPLTTLAPGVVLMLLGMAGAAVAVRVVTATDPNTALGAAR